MGWLGMADASERERERKKFVSCVVDLMKQNKNLGRMMKLINQLKEALKKEVRIKQSYLSRALYKNKGEKKVWWLSFNALSWSFQHFMINSLEILYKMNPNS